MRTSRRCFAPVACLAAALCAFNVVAQPPAPAPDAARRRVAIEKLAVVGSALYIAAHPDDENTAMLAWLAQGRKVRTAYLSLTRGDGGQNLIGTEQGDALILYSAELRWHGPAIHYANLLTYHRDRPGRRIWRTARGIGRWCRMRARR